MTNDPGAEEERRSVVRVADTREGETRVGVAEHADTRGATDVTRQRSLGANV